MSRLCLQNVLHNMTWTQNIVAGCNQRVFSAHHLDQVPDCVLAINVIELLSVIVILMC